MSELHDNGCAGVASMAMGAALGDPKHALVLADIEARLTDEMLRLVPALTEFARRSQLIREEIPKDAHFCQLISAALPLIAFQIANSILESSKKKIFVGDGALYLQELGLSLNDLVREVDLDGRRFLAVALIDKKPAEFDGTSKAGDK